MSSLKILVATGSSGGHVFPALSFLDELKAKYPSTETLLVLPRKNIINQTGILSYNIKYLSVSSIKAELSLKNVLALFDFLKGSLRSLLIIAGFKPDVVVGFGSLSCIPTIIWAWLFRIRILIHEQNVIPGRANRLLAWFSDRIAISFSSSADYLKRHREKIICTGNPLRRELVKIDRLKALELFEFSKDKFTILVMGGSQGSHRINNEFAHAISDTPDKSSLQIIHLGGSADFESLKARYKNLGVNLKLFDFFKPMHYAYSAADLVISRAGAITVSEIVSFGLPAILIPYPHAYAHQLANAEVLEKKGAAVIIRDEVLSGEVLKNNLQYFITHPEALQKMRLAYRDFITTDAASTLVSETLKAYFLK